MTTLIALPRLPDVREEEGAHTELPEMPALTRLLHRARRLPDAPDWQAGVMRALGLERVAAASVAAAALPGLPPDASLCFAAPVHVVAGISRVHLPPGGRLWPDAAEDAAWRAAFNDEFGASGAALHAAAGTGSWLLVAPCAAGARDVAPELLVGETLGRSPAADDVQRALRRLGAEVEMWLASHELNRRREQRSEPVVNAVWFWGGAQRIALPQPAALRGIVTHLPGDAWLAGLAAWTGASLVKAGDWRSALGSAPVQGSSAAGAGDGLVLIAPPAPAGESTASYWQGLEEQWFAPAVQALENGATHTLRLQLAGTTWQVSRGSMRHWLRWRRRRWWQVGAHP
ncbi:MAG TPA: hypothetical protein VNQ32_03190 [Steroidobacteraceae bacterium]|nr:hypothetical protein [Steroidobacteraceae bacterium]